MIDLNKILIKNNQHLNTFIFSTGLVKYVDYFGVLPKAWFIHNEDSVLMTLEELKSSTALRKLLSKHPLFVFVPKNFSISKNCHISSASIREIRKLNLNIIFVLYNENYRNIPLDGEYSDNFNLLKQMRGFAGTNVETAFIPLAVRLGCKKLYFCGVDHIDHGHFWNFDSPYVDKNGNIMSISKLFTQDFLQKSFLKSQKISNDHGLSVFRLSKDKTRLTDYKYVSLYNAIYQTDNPSSVSLKP